MLLRMAGLTCEGYSLKVFMPFRVQRLIEFPKGQVVLGSQVRKSILFKFKLYKIVCRELRTVRFCGEVGFHSKYSIVFRIYVLSYTTIVSPRRSLFHIAHRVYVRSAYFACRFYTKAAK